MRTRSALLAAVVAAGLSGAAALTAAVAAPGTPPGPGDITAQTAGFDFTRPEVVATGLEVPWGLAFLPDGSALVSERVRARITRVRPGTAPTQVAQVAGVSPAGEGGLLGLAVSPTFNQDNLVYAYYTAAGDNRVVRFRLDTPQNQQVLVSGIPRASFHDGGRLAFGPDGMLYASTGDAGQSANAQNPQSLGGKILRMRPDGSAPPDNPSPGSLVYSMGHRHVQGLAWDAQGRLWATEFGQNTWDEINLIVPGGNYGWPTVEGQGNNPSFRDPLVVWTTAEASPSGAAIANNTMFVGALRGTRLWLVPLNGTGVGTPTVELQGAFGRLRTVAVGPDGFLWITTSNRDGRGSPVAADDRVIRIPRDGAGGTPTATPTTGAPSTPPAGGACTVRYEVNEWSTGFTANVTVTNGGAARQGWSLSWTFPGNQQITSAWNTTLNQTGPAVVAGNVDWNAAVPAGGSVSFGFQASYSGSNPRPADFRLNGAACGIG